MFTMRYYLQVFLLSWRTVVEVADAADAGTASLREGGVRTGMKAQNEAEFK